MSTLTGNLGAFLDTIAWSEIGPDLLARSDNGYNVVVGGTLFDNGYVDHPRQRVLLRNGIESTAAGRYQILERYWDAYAKMLHLDDGFTPANQDMVAMQMIGECSAILDAQSGDFDGAIAKCRSRWASLPGADYPGQHMQRLDDLRVAFTNAGGTIATG